MKENYFYEIQSKELRSRKMPVNETFSLDENVKQALETGRNRLLVTGVMFMIVFVTIAIRLIELSAFGVGKQAQFSLNIPTVNLAAERSDIIDRNGIVLATSLPTASLYADPKDILNPEETADKLAGVFSELNPQELLIKLKSKSRFVWINRTLTPEEQYAVIALGLPGIFFRRGEQRVYPHGREAAHVLGLTDIDGKGIAGIEKYFATSLNKGGEPLQLSVDVRIQSLFRQELDVAMEEFQARGAAGVILDVNTGEVISMVSLPDFDPNNHDSLLGSVGFNSVTKGVYEMGSAFKLFTTAMALDTGTVGLKDGYDASKPIKISRFIIKDYHGKNRWLTVPEILIHSSNIGAAKMSLDVGTKTQKYYLDQLGLLQPLNIELPEIGQPQYPSRWGDISTMTISYGHGISVSPLQLAWAVSTLVNGGKRMPLSLLKHHSLEPPVGTRVLSEETSLQMRKLMHLVVTDGTGKKAAAPGYLVGGKTGTAEKQVNGGYDKKSLRSSFVGAFPMDKPRYVILAMLDEPKGTDRTSDYATGGWVAAPIISRLVSRMATLLGILPRFMDGPSNNPTKITPRAASLGLNSTSGGGYNSAAF